MYLYNENGKHLGWFTWKDAYEASKNIDFAVYSFAFMDKIPKNNVLPFQLEDTFYIGILMLFINVFELAKLPLFLIE